MSEFNENKREKEREREIAVLGMKHCLDKRCQIAATFHENIFSMRISSISSIARAHDRTVVLELVCRPFHTISTANILQLLTRARVLDSKVH